MTSLSPGVEERFQTAQAMRRAVGNACPKALQVEPDDLAALLAVVMEEDIQRTRKTLPREMSSILGTPENDAQDSSILSLEEFTRIGDVSPDFTLGDGERAPLPEAPSSSRIVPSQFNDVRASEAHATAQGRPWLWAAAVTLGLTFGGIAIAIAISMRPSEPASAATRSSTPTVAAALPTPRVAVTLPTAPEPQPAVDEVLAHGVNAPDPEPVQPAHHRGRRRAPSTSRRAPSASAAQPASATTTTMQSTPGPIIDTVEF